MQQTNPLKNTDISAVPIALALSDVLAGRSDGRRHNFRAVDYMALRGAGIAMNDNAVMTEAGAILSTDTGRENRILKHVRAHSPIAQNEAFTRLSDARLHIREKSCGGMSPLRIRKA